MILPCSPGTNIDGATWAMRVVDGMKQGNAMLRVETWTDGMCARAIVGRLITIWSKRAERKS